MDENLITQEVEDQASGAIACSGHFGCRNHFAKLNQKLFSHETLFAANLAATCIAATIHNRLQSIV